MTTGSIINDHRYSFQGRCGIDNYTGLYYSRVWTGENSPTLHSENNYDCEIISRSNPVGLVTIWGDSPQPSSYAGCFGGHVSAPIPLWEGNDEISLIAKLGDQIRGHSFNAGIFVGESRESLQMISNAARSLASSLYSLKRGDISGAAKALGMRPARGRQSVPSASRSQSVLNEKWLELEFGWRPLVRDLYEGGQAVFAATNKPLTKTYRASMKLWGPLETSTGKDLSPRAAFYMKEYRVTLKEDISLASSLGLDDPLLIAWNLMPFSFVADWALPVGNYLKARSVCNLIGSDNVASTVYKGFDIRTKWCDPRYYTYTGDFFIDRYRNVVRRHNVSLSVPAPTIKDFSKIFTWRHTVDSLALLYQHSSR